MAEKLKGQFGTTSPPRMTSTSTNPSAKVIIGSGSKFWVPRTQKVWKLGQEWPKNPKVSLGRPRRHEWPRPQPICAQRSKSDRPWNSEWNRHKKCQKRLRNGWISSIFHFKPSQSLAGVGRPISKVKVKCAEGQNQNLHVLLIPEHPLVSILAQGLPQNPSPKFSISQFDPWLFSKKIKSEESH